MLGSLIFACIFGWFHWNEGLSVVAALKVAARWTTPIAAALAIICAITAVWLSRFRYRRSRTDSNQWLWSAEKWFGLDAIGYTILTIGLGPLGYASHGPRYAFAILCDLVAICFFVAATRSAAATRHHYRQAHHPA